MERIPTQTDIMRICGAADDVIGFYHRRFLTNIGTARQLREMQRLANRMSEFHSQVKTAPYESEFFIRISSKQVDATFSQWHGWSRQHFNAYVTMVNCAKQVVESFPALLELTHRKVDAAAYQHDGDSMVTRTKMDDWKSSVRHLRNVCQFTPCPLQQEILQVCDGRSLTADALMSANCRVSSASG